VSHLQRAGACLPTLVTAVYAGWVVLQRCKGNNDVVLFCKVYWILHFYKVVIPPSITSSDSFLYRHLEERLSELISPQGADSEKPRVFVCENFTCKLPVQTVEDLEVALQWGMARERCFFFHTQRKYLADGGHTFLLVFCTLTETYKQINFLPCNDCCSLPKRYD